MGHPVADEKRASPAAMAVALRFACAPHNWLRRGVLIFPGLRLSLCHVSPDGLMRSRFHEVTEIASRVEYAQKTQAER